MINYIILLSKIFLERSTEIYHTNSFSNYLLNFRLISLYVRDSRELSYLSLGQNEVLSSQWLPLLLIIYKKFLRMVKLPLSKHGKFAPCPQYIISIRVIILEECFTIAINPLKY